MEDITKEKLSKILEDVRKAHRLRSCFDFIR